MFSSFAEFEARMLCGESTVTPRVTEVPIRILPEAEFATGTYELVFAVGDYHGACGVDSGSPRFLDLVPLRFGLSEARHYHVPLLVSPFGYSTYRGS